MDERTITSFTIPEGIERYAKESSMILFSRKRNSFRVYINSKEFSKRFETEAKNEEDRKFIAEEIARHFGLKIATPPVGSDYRSLRLVPQSLFSKTTPGP